MQKTSKNFNNIAPIGIVLSGGFTKAAIWHNKNSYLRVDGELSQLGYCQFVNSFLGDALINKMDLCRLKQRSF